MGNQALPVEAPPRAAKLTAPVFLLGAHKSGSSLLRSLLDGHPGLCVLPAEIHYFQLAGYWVDYRLRRAAPRTLDRDELIRSLTGFVALENRNEDRYADSVLTGRLDLDVFRKSIGQADLSGPAAAFAGFARAFAEALGTPLSAGARLVEKSVENAENAVALRHMFPDCRFVHIVRNPYAGLVAVRRARTSRGRFPALADTALSFRNSYYFLFRNLEVLDRYHVLRYEDLLTETEARMREVATFLDLPFRDSLLEPTLMGEPWGGNSSSDKKFLGVSRDPLTRWKDHVTDIEIRVVNRLLGPVLERFGYERLEPRRGTYVPVRGERPRSYLRNRALLWIH
jgi:hypothetical protein